MTQQDDARRFAEVIIRDCGAQALGVVRLRIRLIEDEQRHSAVELWREIAHEIEKLQANDPKRTGISASDAAES